MKFAYLPLPVRQASPSLGTGTARYRPILPVHIVAPIILPPVDACIDSASDDTVFPPYLLSRLGVDVTNAPSRIVRLIGGTTIKVTYASVSLLLSDGFETCEWDAVVAFSAVPMRWALLGHAGFLEHFDVQLLGARREAWIMPTPVFSGRHLYHVNPTP